jgi:hypothetical protein
MLAMVTLACDDGGSEFDSLCPYDFMNNREHCGGCNHACLLDDTCEQGACIADRNWALWPMPELPLQTDQYEVLAQTVKDSVTALEWQLEPIAGIHYTEAENACRELDLDGGDWRLPTRIELASIVDFTKRLPAIDSQVFAETPSAEFKHQVFPRRRDPEDRSTDPTDVIDFTEGSKLYFEPGVRDLEYNTTPYVRCVRGGTPPRPAGDRYETDGETVLDVYTRLRWQHDIPECADSLDCPASSRFESYEAVVAYCGDLTLGPYDDFRVPTILELYTLMYPLSPLTAQFDPRVFPDESTDPTATFYSSTPYSGVEGVPVKWNMEYARDAGVTWEFKGVRVRCVRSEL